MDMQIVLFQTVANMSTKNQVTKLWRKPKEMHFILLSKYVKFHSLSSYSLVKIMNLRQFGLGPF